MGALLVRLMRDISNFRERCRMASTDTRTSGNEFLALGLELRALGLEGHQFTNALRPLGEQAMQLAVGAGAVEPTEEMQSIDKLVDLLGEATEFLQTAVDAVLARQGAVL